VRITPATHPPPKSSASRKRGEELADLLKGAYERAEGRVAKERGGLENHAKKKAVGVGSHNARELAPVGKYHLDEKEKGRPSSPEKEGKERAIRGLKKGAELMD